MKSLILSLIIIVSFSKNGESQPFPYIDIHKNSKNLNDCIHLNLRKKVRSGNHLPFTLKELLALTTTKQTLIDSLAKRLGYELDSTSVETSVWDSLRSFFVVCHYKFQGSSFHAFQTRKLCSQYNKEHNNCEETFNLITSMPLSLYSKNLKEYLLYKSELLKSSLNFKLKLCQVIHGGKNRIWYVKEVFENSDYFITFKIYCKKVKEKEDGFHLKRYFGFEMHFYYTESYINRTI
ncbi:hypothetical protein [Aureispira sp. CCB-E]|uniref:hypothetical protein n=1 Tax=Aureispira sp. CCB-E TaxID=3051121 RepID=UPI002868F3C5|nr:hypothetical protein [Aureispira sp. CCB-E]WMX12367.1 hypothetical protein QP953_16175 [Aureispira sp. CCB-E]